MRMIALTVSAAASILAVGIATRTEAAACRDAHGKFVACAAQPQRCRAANGAFVKCGTPGAKPIASSAKATNNASTGLAKMLKH